MVIPTITFANRPSVSDSADPSFQDYLQDHGQAESFLAFRQLDKFAGNIPSVPGPRPWTLCSGQAVGWHSAAGEEQKHRPEGRPLQRAKSGPPFIPQKTRDGAEFQNQNRMGRPPKGLLRIESAPPYDRAMQLGAAVQRELFRFLPPSL